MEENKTVEERLENIETRLKKLEEKERRRQIAGIVKAIITIALIVLVVVAGLYLYKEFTEKLEPIMEFTQPTDEYFNWKNIIENYTK